MIAEHLDAARAELRITTKAQINAATAAAWGARAVAAYEFYAQTGDLGWRDHAIEYAHEAIEHSADGPPGTLEAIRAELKTLTKGLVDG
jgi:enoyl-CoA hydratase/carnithine racemase